MSALVFAPLLTAEVHPGSGWYVRVDEGVASAREPELRIPSGPLPADLGEANLVGGGIGWSLVAGLRADFTLTYRSGFEQVSGFPAMPEGRADFRSYSALVSLYLDLMTARRFSPYGGFGIGLAHNKLEEVRITNPDGSLLGTIGGKEKSNYAWQLCAGGTFQISNRWLLDFGYHFFQGGDYESQGLLHFTDGSSAFAKDTGKFRTHELMIGLQYIF